MNKTKISARRLELTKAAKLAHENSVVAVAAKIKKKKRRCGCRGRK